MNAARAFKRQERIGKALSSPKPRRPLTECKYGCGTMIGFMQWGPGAPRIPCVIVNGAKMPHACDGYTAARKERLLT